MPEPSAPAWHRLVLENRGLAKKEAARARRPGRVSYDEMLSAAYLGSTVAAGAFDPARGTRFSTLAVHIIRQKIAEELQSTPYGPIRTSKGAFHEDASPAVRKAARRAQRVTSLDGPGGGARGKAAEDPSPLETACRAEEAEAIGRTIARLRPREREVILARFYERLTLRETGERIGASKERVRQIQAEAIERLRKLLAGRPKG